MRKQLMIAAIAALSTIPSHANTVRATELTAEVWQDLQTGKSTELTVEFREDDEIPVQFHSEGDLLESTRTGTTLVRAKRRFFVRFHESEVLFSLDGIQFKPFTESVGGTFEVDIASKGQTKKAKHINMTLKAFIK